MPVFNSNLEKYQYFYEKKWVSDVQLRLYVSFGELTADEYKIITGKTYQAP